MSALAGPVQPYQRIHYMDALRGFALLGIFIINVPEGFTFWSAKNTNTGPYFSSFDSSMHFLHVMFIEGKFYSLFSLLFGWGLALQWQRLKDKGITSVSLLRRRLFIMMLLGFLHIMLVWTGDIILFYSLLGFVLLSMRNWSDRRLVYGGFVLVLSPILLYFLKMHLAWVNWPAAKLYELAGNVDFRLNGIRNETDMRLAFQRPSYGSLLRMNTSGLFFRYADLIFISRAPKVLGMFMIGFYLGRQGNYKRFLDNKKKLWFIFITGMAIGIPCNYYHALYANWNDYFNLTMKGWYKTLFYGLAVVPLALSYAAGMALFFQTRLGKGFAYFFQPVGKMAFSNYITQSLMGVFIFFGVGLGMIDSIGPVYSTVLVVLLFILQAVFSKIWLNYFAYGPVEWLWRSLTYKKAQPVRKVGAPQAMA